MTAQRTRTTATRTTRAAPAKKAARPAEAVGGSGLEGFAMHMGDSEPQNAMSVRALQLNATRPEGRARNANLLPTKQLDPETAARGYLDSALADRQLPSFNRPAIDGAISEFGSLGTESVPLTGTRMVKFRQTFNKIPVYGSYVTVELDKNNKCIGINSSMGTPKGAPQVATVAPARALAIAAKASAQAPESIKSAPRLYYYFDQKTAKWKLAYIIEDVRQGERVRKGKKARDALRKDYVIDAVRGTVLAALPRTPTATQVSARDGLGVVRRFVVEKKGARAALRDRLLNVTTYDFAFKDPSRNSKALPGVLIENPPGPWPVAAVAAHANAEVVARFLRKVVKRNNIDNRGGELISSIDCWDRADGTRVPKEWQNAYWDGDQMVYGQIAFPDGSLYSVANMLDIVGHEMFHGVTDHTSRLEYQTQAGALNESFSDIFGTIIGNWGKPLHAWTWELGKGFGGPGVALRNMRDPTLHDQPKHMRDFEKSKPPYTYDRNDYGHVHDNSGIHNYAAYRIMTAKTGNKYLFTPAELAALFYIAVTLQLSRTSQFADSRRAVVQAARSLFRGESAGKRNARIAAVEQGFSAAGIM